MTADFTREKRCAQLFTNCKCKRRESTKQTKLEDGASVHSPHALTDSTIENELWKPLPPNEVLHHNNRNWLAGTAS